MSTVGLTTTVWATALSTAVMGGVYFTFSSFVMSSLAALPKAQGIAAMQSVNRVILSSSFMPVFFLSSLAALGLAITGMVRWGSPGATALVLGGLIYALGMFVCTAAANVPLNDALDATDPNSVEGAQLWAHYLRAWTRWNHLRTAASLAATGLFVSAAVALR